MPSESIRSQHLWTEHAAGQALDRGGIATGYGLVGPDANATWDTHGNNFRSSRGTAAAA